MNKLMMSAAALVALTAAPVSAAEFSYFGGKVSTLGAGAEVGIKLNDRFGARLIANGYNYGYDDTLDGINYDGDLKLGSYGAQLDFYMTSSLYATAGLYANQNKLELRGTPTGPTQIGGMTFTPEEIGTVSMNADFKKTVPYAGLGYNFGNGPWVVNLEAGAYFQDAAEVSLTSNGTLADTSVYQNELEQERQNIQADLDDFKVYPVVNLGLRYKF